MKLNLILLILGWLFISAAHAQQKPITKAKDTTSQVNFIDAQFDVMKDVLGGDQIKENPMAGFENYKQMLIQSDLNTAFKQELLAQYQMIELKTLIPNKKIRLRPLSRKA
ncbi:hypothetical protein [Croceiramulus getboli]|nr:hypothetical protein P8624_09695 [Flavobacteriaceae bacterium YJPT1-3]